VDSAQGDKYGIITARKGSRGEEFGKRGTIKFKKF
jgi:hypothetical protein